MVDFSDDKPWAYTYVFRTLSLRLFAGKFISWGPIT